MSTRLILLIVLGFLLLLAVLLQWSILAWLFSALTLPVG